MEQNKKTQKELLIQKQFQSLLKSHSERMTTTEQIVSSLQKSISGVLEISREQRDNDKQKLLKYLNATFEKVKPLSLQEGIAFLQTEKRGFEVKTIKANISKDGYAKKFYQVVIDEILNPLINMQNEIILQEKQIGTLALNEDNTSDTAFQKRESQVLEKSDQKLPEGFKQIECSATQSEIQSFFMRLFTSINESNERPYMTEENVIKLIHRNFKIFEKEPSGGYIPLNLTQRQKGRLRYFIYDFYSQFGGGKSKSKLEYVDFLIWNFELFKDDNRTNLNKSVNARSKPKNDLI